MKNCKYTQTLLPLYDGDALTAIEKRQVDDHLATCNRCREELAAIRALHADLQRANTFEPGEAMLADLRRGLRRRLRQESLKPNWQERLGSLLFGSLQPVWRLGFAAALVLAGMAIGRQVLSPASGPAENLDVLSQLTPGKPVAIPSGYLAPSLANVQAIRFDPATKQVEIQFSMVNDVQLRGSVNDPAISRALTYALYEEEQPNLRLRAVKAISETYASTGGTLQDDELTAALLYALEKDPNDGVRLKAVQVLKQLPLNNLVKTALIRVLMRDANSAVRIGAIEALGRGDLSQDERAVFHSAAADSNEYIRLQAKRLLSGQLEQTPAHPDKNKL